MRADAALAAQFVSAGVDWIVPDWPAPASVRAFSTTRNGVGGRAVDFARDRDAAARALLKSFLPGEPLWLAQAHGTAIASADVGHGRAPEADVAVSRCPGNVCAVLSADCLPVLLADRRGSVVAARMRDGAGCLRRARSRGGSMQTAPANVLAWLGPAIGPSAFEVGPDVHAAFCDRDAAAGALRRDA
jgi:copper oxidase (laccase) domain-containing protein